MGEGEMIKKLLPLNLLIFSLTACVSPMKVSQSRSFAISKETPVIVSVPNDYAGIQGRVEAKLLELGINVVPIDIAKRSLELKQQISVATNSAAVQSSLENSIYYPTAMVVAISYQIRTDAIMSGFNYFNARFLDLSSQRVLGVASFSQGANWVSVDYTLESFSREVASYVK
jgi:hypothetical protein